MTRKRIFAFVRYCFLLACLVGVTEPARAQSGSLDVRPLFRIEGEFTTGLTSPPVLLNKESIFVSRGGYIFLQGTIESTNGTFDGIVGRAFANATQRSVFRDILTRGQVGRQRDCVRISTELSGYWQITWYGRNGRRNTFCYVSAPDLSSGLPECSEQARDLLEGLTTIAAVIVVDGGEFFITPPGP